MPGYVRHPARQLLFADSSRGPVRHRCALVVAVQLVLGTIGLSGCGHDASGGYREREEPASEEGSVLPASSAREGSRPKVRPGNAPVVVSLSGPKRLTAGAVFTLDVVVERRAEGGAYLSIELPEGVELVSGSLEEALPMQGTLLRRELVVRLVGDVPPADITLEVEAAGDNYGALARARYRFGRPAPRLPEPPRAGAPLRVHGVSLGAPIPLH